jgi:PD-(D/E)XK nuclease superfamily
MARMSADPLPCVYPPMRFLVLDTAASWADAVAALPARGPLPSRTVLVPSERHAHALRRALASSGRGAALAGTRFLGPLTAAAEVLRAAGVPFSKGEDALRPARLLAHFHEDLRLEHFDPDLFRSTRGWDAAFASAIRELEGAGFSPRDLPMDTPQLRDVAAIWAHASAEAGRSLGAARIHLEAAALLGRDPAAWPFRGPALALATGHEEVAVARFLAAIPDATLGLRVSQPVRPRLLVRIERLYGLEASNAIAAWSAVVGGPLQTVGAGPVAVGTGVPGRGSPAPVGGPPAAAGAAGAAGGPRRPTERDLLATYLFADSKVLADPARPRSAGPDGTVDLEEHAGVEAELEATAAWVARQVLEARRPLEEIAVLVPAQDPLAQLVADRLERLPFEGGPLPVYVAAGLPAISTAAGARVLAVLRALASCLSAETLAPVLPALRLEPPRGAEPAGAGAAGAPAEPAAAAAAVSPGPGIPTDPAAARALRAARSHLTHGEAMELAYSLGTVGGNAARPEGALDWAARAAARVAELELALGHARAGEDSAGRDAWRLERRLENLRAIQPALAGLAGAAFSVVGDAPLALLWSELDAFLRRWLLVPGDGRAILARLAESLAPACAGAPGRKLTGHDALAVVEERLRALRIPRGRFGSPAVYVGTVQGAAGLEFAAVRVVGLCEGVIPSPPLEDPVLPESARAALAQAAPGRVLALAEDRVAAQVHGLVSAIRGAREVVALSAPRVDLARTEREPASLFIDAAAALARPDAITGERADAVPSTGALRRDHFRPSGAASAAFRAARPVSEASWLDRVARHAPDLPQQWERDPVLALARVDALTAAGRRLGPADGVLGPGEPFPLVPGLSAERPISASGLKDLLQCPRMFLMKRILGWEEPAGAPSLRELDAAPYGSLLHHVLEVFYRAHGAQFVGGARSIGEWQELGRELADRHLDAFLREYPLVGEGVREKERERLRESVRVFLEYDWGTPGRRYVGVELPFGDEVPLQIPAGGRTLHVRGFIDRVDVEGGATLVRDLKSGKAHRRAAGEADAVLDVQLGLYQLAARQLASAWGTPPEVVAAYAYASGRASVEERAFRGGDARLLEERTRAWLAGAAGLLAERNFAPTPDEEDCVYCPFKPLCGASAARRAREALAAEEGALAAFRELRLGEGEEE